MNDLHGLVTRRPAVSVGEGGAKETDKGSVERRVLEDENASLRQKVLILEGSNLRLSRRWVELHARLTELKQQSGIWSEPMGPPRRKHLPKFLGVVIAVGDGAPIAVINIGKEQGVEVGAEFLLFRGTRFVGFLVAEKVHSRKSVCRVFTISTREKVEFGDQVR
ncbi:MAG: hypothetical protein ACYS47_00315 [Planctomycetota bacterium]